MSAASIAPTASLGSADPNAWTIAEPTFGVAKGVIFRLTRNSVVFEDGDTLEIPRDRVDRVELQDWWESYRRIALTYRDGENTSQVRTFVVVRRLGPDAVDTERLFAVLTKEFGSRAKTVIDTPGGSRVVKKKASPRMVALRVISIAIAIIFIAAPAVAIVFRGAIADSLGVTDRYGGASSPRPSPNAILSFLPGGAPVDSGEPSRIDRVNAINDRKRATATFPGAEAAQNGIQASLDKLTDALWRGDSKSFMDQVDVTSHSWKEVQSDYFSLMRGSGQASDKRVEAELIEVRQAPKGYYRALVRVATSNSEYSNGVELGWWVFRFLNNRWLLAEPDERDLGNRLSKDMEKFSLVYWEWDKEFLDEYGEWAQAAYDRVAAKLGSEPDKKPRIIFRPIYRTYRSDMGFGEAGLYHTGIPDEVYVRSPYSYGGMPWREDEQPGTGAVKVIAHELTHLFHHQKFVSVRQTPLWMAEGLAEYVSEGTNKEVVRWAERHDKLLSITQLDNHSFDPTEESVGQLFYAQSAMLVAYIDEKWGMDAFWDLARRYAAIRRGGKPIQDVLGVTPEQMTQNFKVWVRAKLK